MHTFGVYNKLFQEVSQIKPPMFEEQPHFFSIELISWLHSMPLIPECNELEIIANNLSPFACLMPSVTGTQILVFKDVGVYFKFSTFQIY